MSEYRGKECVLPEPLKFWDQGYLRDAVNSWENETYLSYELERIDSRLTKRQWSILLSAIRSNLPVVIQHRDGVLDGTMFVAEHTMMVEYMAVNEITNANRIRVHYWGFGHDLYLSEILSITTPDSKLTRESEVVIRTND